MITSLSMRDMCLVLVSIRYTVLTSKNTPLSWSKEMAKEGLLLSGFIPKVSGNGKGPRVTRKSRRPQSAAASLSNQSLAAFSNFILFFSLFRLVDHDEQLQTWLDFRSASQSGLCKQQVAFSAICKLLLLQSWSNHFCLVPFQDFSHCRDGVVASKE